MTTTWLDMFPQGHPKLTDLLTRDELVKELEDRGVHVTKRTLSFWHAAGVLPYPVQQGTGRGAHALYPRWFVPAVNHLRDLQACGFTLGQIRRFMTLWATTCPYRCSTSALVTP